MRKDWSHLEPYRVKTGPLLYVQASDGERWEHVSISIIKQDRCPTWDEMCWIKGMFWDKEECVIQYHPPEKDYITDHPYCLHLWKPIGQPMPRPPKYLIGIGIDKLIRAK